VVHEIVDCPDWHPYNGREEVSAYIEHAVCIDNAMLDERSLKARVVDEWHDVIEVRENFADGWVADQLAFI
jgi:hypothetical protein